MIGAEHGLVASGAVSIAILVVLFVLVLVVTFFDGRPR